MELDSHKLNEDDLYIKLKKLQRQIEFLSIQEEYIKDEQKNLKRELLRAQEEVKRIQSVPLMVGQFLEMIDPLTGLSKLTAFFVHKLQVLLDLPVAQASTFEFSVQLIENC